MGRKKKCPYDCFSCPYEDCISGSDAKINKKDFQKQYQKEYREKNEDHVKELQRQWAINNREAISLKNRQKWQIIANKKRNTCCQCGTKYRKSRQVIKYHKKYFCSFDCLGKYMVEEAKSKELLKFETYIVKGETWEEKTILLK